MEYLPVQTKEDSEKPVDEALAQVLAALTGEPVAEWRRRTLVWPDTYESYGHQTICAQTDRRGARE